jgi:hypothetical protein
MGRAFSFAPPASVHRGRIVTGSCVSNIYTPGVSDVPPELLDLLRGISSRRLAYVSSVVTGLLGGMIQ